MVMAQWSLLPPEVLALVFRFVELGSLYHCFSVNKQWRAAARDDCLWKDRALLLFSCAGETEKAEAEKEPSAPSWYERFKEAAQLKFCFHPLLADSAFTLRQAFSHAHREGRKGSCPKLILSTQEQCKRTGFSRAFSTNPFAASSVVRGKFTPPSDIPEIETSTKERRVQAELQENCVMFTQWQNKRVRLEFEVHENWEVGLFHDPKSFHRFFSTGYFSYGLSPIASTYMCTTFSMGDNQLTHSSIPPTLIRNFTSPPSSADALRKYFVSNPCDSKSLARERREFGCLLEVKQTALEWSRPQRWADAVTLVVEVDGRAKQVKFTINGAESEPLPTPFEPFVLALTTGNSNARIALVQQSVTLCL